MSCWAGSFRGRLWALFVATNGHFLVRLWADSHGRQHCAVDSPDRQPLPFDGA